MVAVNTTMYARGRLVAQSSQNEKAETSLFCMRRARWLLSVAQADLYLLHVSKLRQFLVHCGSAVRERVDVTVWRCQEWEAGRLDAAMMKR